MPSPLAAECTTSVSPACSRPRLKRARCEVWNVSRNAVASASSNSGGASNTEMASATAYSAMPPSAFLVMATTRLPSHASAPSPTCVDHAAHVHAQRERRRGRHRDEVAPAAVDVVEVQRGRAHLDPHLVRSRLGRSTVCTARTSPGCPWRVTCRAFMSATRGSPSGLSAWARRVLDDLSAGASMQCGRGLSHDCSFPIPPPSKGVASRRVIRPWRRELAAVRAFTKLCASRFPCLPRTSLPTRP